MYVREATPDDNDELQQLQARCPVGTTLILSTVNTPDFFGRAKAYESYKVFAACEDDRIIGSAACALRNALVNGEIRRVGYEFQAFVSPDYRRRGVATQLHQQREAYLTQQGAVLTYALIIEGNHPAMRYIEIQGFKRHRTLVTRTLLVYREMGVPARGKIRPITFEDLDTVADLLNKTWQGFELYEPTSAESLARFVDRVPAYSFDNLLVLEDQGEIVACLGYWDWSRITRITVQATKFGLGVQVMKLVLDVVRHFRPMPRVPKPGDILKQWVLTPIAFTDPGHLAVLLRYVNNCALLNNTEQLLCICEEGQEMLSSTKGFFYTDIGVHLYVKPLQQNLSLSDQPVFINGIDL